MSLWGSRELYSRGAVANARLARVIYPGWTMRVYCSPDVPVIDMLRALDVEVRIVQEGHNHAGLFWRFLPTGETGLEHVVVRDADSRLNLREKAAVDAWIASGQTFHVMRDHPHHRHAPMLGGMWGCRGRAIPDISARLTRFKASAAKHDDTYFLRDEIWPIAQRDCLVHSSVPEPLGGEPFPEHAPFAGFVGQIVPPAETDDPIAILIPSRGRPDAALSTAMSARATASRPDSIHIAVGIEPDEEAAYFAAFADRSTWLHTLESGGNYVRAVRELHRRTRPSAIYGLLADDFIFESPDWDTCVREAVAELPDRVGLVYGDDGLRREWLATAPFLTSEWIRSVGDILPGDYGHMFCDTELTDIARRAGLLHYLPGMRLTHRHHSAGHTEFDSTYQHAAQTWSAGTAEFEHRKSDRMRLACRMREAAGASGHYTAGGLPTMRQRLLLGAALRRDDEAPRSWKAWLAVSSPARADVESRRLFASVWWNLNRLGLRGTDIDALLPYYRESWAATQAQINAAARATHLLQDAGIDAIVVGGVAVASRYYETPHLRSLRRVDLLVRSSAVEDVQRLIASTPETTSVSVQAEFLDAGVPADLDGIWARAEVIAIGGARVRVLSPTDELLRVCGNGLRDRRFSRVVWAADALAILGTASDHLEFDVLENEARARSVHDQVRVALDYVRALTGANA